MKIKKRLKYKSTLPKADFSMDPNALSNMNKQAAAEETESSGPDLAKGANIANGINMGLQTVGSFTPQDNNDGIGISHRASQVTSGISSGLDAVGGIASSIPGAGPIVGAALGGVSSLIKMIKGAVDHKI